MDGVSGGVEGVAGEQLQDDVSLRSFSTNDDDSETTLSTDDGDDVVNDNDIEARLETLLFDDIGLGNSNGQDSNDEDDDDEDRIDGFDNPIDHVVEVEYGRVDKFLLEKAKKEIKKIRANILTLTESQSPTPFKLFSLYFEPTMKRMMKWVLLRRCKQNTHNTCGICSDACNTFIPRRLSGRNGMCRGRSFRFLVRINQSWNTSAPRGTDNEASVVLC